MAVKIVTDSSSDIPEDIARDLDIEVVPLYVRFGTETLRDGIDIKSDEFFRRLTTGDVIPTTSAPSPGDFAQVYEKFSQSAGIISIHVTRRLSATYDAAMQGKTLLSGTGCPVEIVDSKLCTIATGLAAIAAARAAKAGQTLQQVREHLNSVLPNIKAFGFLDSLKYIIKGGRLGKVAPMLGSVISVKPILTMKDGLLSPVGVVRTRSKGLDRLCELIKASPRVEEIGISHSVNDLDLKTFTDKIKSILPEIKPVIAKLGPALGVHGGPDTILVTVKHVAEAIIEAEGRKPIINLPSLQSIKDGLRQRLPRDIVNPTDQSFSLQRV